MRRYTWEGQCEGIHLVLTISPTFTHGRWDRLVEEGKFMDFASLAVNELLGHNDALAFPACDPDLGFFSLLPPEILEKIVILVPFQICSLSKSCFHLVHQMSCRVLGQLQKVCPLDWDYLRRLKKTIYGHHLLAQNIVPQKSSGGDTYLVWHREYESTVYLRGRVVLLRGPNSRNFRTWDGQWCMNFERRKGKVTFCASHTNGLTILSDIEKMVISPSLDENMQNLLCDPDFSVLARALSELS